MSCRRSATDRVSCRDSRSDQSENSQISMEHNMKKQKTSKARLKPTTEQKFLSDLREEHVRYEFLTRNTEDTLTTMVENAYVNHVPVLTGGTGYDQLREF